MAFETPDSATKFCTLLFLVTDPVASICKLSPDPPMLLSVSFPSSEMASASMCCDTSISFPCVEESVTWLVPVCFISPASAVRVSLPGMLVVP